MQSTTKIIVTVILRLKELFQQNKNEENFDVDEFTLAKKLLLKKLKLGNFEATSKE